MLKVSRTLYWRWRPDVVRIGAGAIFYLPGFVIQLGYHNPPCRVCGTRDEIYAWDEYNPGATICIDCCEHPGYEYDRCERRRFCVECGNEPPIDWGGYGSDDDIGLSFYSCRDACEPIGTPISQLSGRPGHQGYEEFKRIAKSWGHD
jgi:hypothetical protein